MKNLGIFGLISLVLFVASIIFGAFGYLISLTKTNPELNGPTLMVGVVLTAGFFLMLGEAHRRIIPSIQNTMKDERKQQLDEIAKMLADPKVTVQDLENYKAKAKVLMETVEMAQEAELKAMDRQIKGVTKGLLG